MPLPVRKAADLAKDMAAKGLVGSISMGEPPAGGDEEESPMTGGVEDVVKDIDALVPGLGKLIQELCERMAQPSYEEDEE